MLNIKEKLARRDNYAGKRKTSDIKYLVIHYTGNDGDTDENNGIYFGREYVGVSAHYFVDSDSATRSVPEDFVAIHCGASSYRHPECRNANSIGIEICDDNRNGTIYPSAQTISNVLELTEMLMAQYGIPKENVIRHYDVSGKVCPGYWAGTAEKDALWHSEFWDKLGGEAAPAPQEKPREDVLYRVQVGAYRVRENAQEMLDRLQAAGFEGFIVTDKAQDTQEETEPRKSIDQVAREVIDGLWGNGAERRRRLTEAGYDFDEVQQRVNELLGG